MFAAMRNLFCLISILFILSGCYSTPVRHLASDIALIKPGESTREDVLTYLGEPDEQEIIGQGAEKWVFQEYESSALKDAPLVGKYFGTKDYGIVTVILKDNVVVDCIYGAFDEDAMDWASDFGWQEKD